ncbi:putative phospho-2-dehydro-3-deoxyheptonate aldolase [Klebsiella pneumoniae]|uniref:Putative phospho-2-dehydro-3-deoxyheptonate aldolase n=1 Tax=Klebsiella pneumoniae TaxID=573 RepID=A0A377ZIZ3_KLEPN|nr:putative phospho-2-dehydro-3-deoxyheptonate aldolase [Klebsiella pneumoniae]VTN18756.1 putative phospho-2-dehydro-3-deoxyheptonate aldolase [Klebsiella pneumoniae]
MSKERRLSRIFAKDGKSVTLALDGYYFSTKTNGIDNTINQLPALVEHGLDCALVTYGMLKNYREALNSVPVVLRVDSTVSIFDNTVPDTTPVFSVEDALKVAAEGVVCMTFPGAFNEEKNPHYGDATRTGSGSLECTADCRIAPVWLSRHQR